MKGIGRNQPSYRIGKVTSVTVFIGSSLLDKELCFLGLHLAS